MGLMYGRKVGHYREPNQFSFPTLSPSVLLTAISHLLLPRPVRTPRDDSVHNLHGLPHECPCIDCVPLRISCLLEQWLNTAGTISTLNTPSSHAAHSSCFLQSATSPVRSIKTSAYPSPYTLIERAARMCYYQAHISHPHEVHTMRSTVVV